MIQLDFRFLEYYTKVFLLNTQYYILFAQDLHKDLFSYLNIKIYGYFNLSKMHASKIS